MNIDDYIATPGREERDALRADLATAESERDALLVALREIEHSRDERVYDDAGNGNQRERFVVDSASVKRIAREAIAAAEGGK